MKFFAALKAFGEKLLADVEVPLKTSDKLYLSAKAVIDQLPADKAVFLGLVDRAEAFASCFPAVVAGEGLNFVADENTVTSGLALVAYFRSTFLPAIDKGVDALKAAADQPSLEFEPSAPANPVPAFAPAPSPIAVVTDRAPASTAETAGAGSDVPQPGPGRHNVIAP